MTNGQVPQQPKIYHIAHVDRLPSIIADGCLWCDAEVERRAPPGTMNSIKTRRLRELRLDSHPDLHVGDCVPFYFCPRSVMLYLIYQGNHAELRAITQSWFIAAAKVQSSTSRPTFRRRLRGRMSNAGAGRSLCRMPARISLRIAATWRTSARSIGPPCRRGIGGDAKKGSKRSSCWNTATRGTSSSASAFIRR